MAVTHPKIQEASNQIQALCGGWLDGDVTRLVLVGGGGVGKTRLLQSVVRWAIGVPKLPAPRPTFIQFERFCDTIENLQVPYDVALVNSYTLNSVKDCGILAIDDIGAETDRFRSGQPTAFLQRMLEDSHGHTSTLISTNVPEDQWATRWDERVADRLLRNSTIINLARVPAWSEAKP